MPLDTARNERFGKIEKLHYISIVFFGVLSIAVIVFAAYFGGIQGKSQHWTDSANEWEMCFTQVRNVVQHYLLINPNATYSLSLII